MINNLTKELAESLVEMRNFADIGEIPAAAYMVRADAVLDRYVDALRTPEPKMTINLKDYENKLVVATLRNEWRIVDILYTNEGFDCYPYSIDGRNYTYNGRILISEESPYDIIDIKLVDEDQEPVITRVEVITDKREYVNWNPDNKITTSLQDDGKTLKIFVTKTTEEPEMPITKPEFHIEPEVIEDLRNTGNYKTFANSIADMMSSSIKASVSNQWATALSGLIDKLGGDSPALWEWEGKTPTPEKVVECLRENIQYIADGELEACCAVMEMNEGRVSGNVLRAIRRPQPTLKSQALKDFETVRKHSDLLPEILDTIENALKSIPE